MKELVRRLALLVAALLIMASFVISGWALKSRFQEGNQTRRNQTEAIRTVLCFFQGLIPPSNPRYAEAAQLYNRALALIHAQPCPAPKGPQ